MDQTLRPVLEGEVGGKSRSELLTSAAAKAAEYFGTTCVAVRLENERPTIQAFRAEFRAMEHHEVYSSAYGPGKCQGCGKSSWPQDPLPRAKW